MRVVQWFKRKSLFIKILCVAAVFLVIAGVWSAYSFYHVTLKHYHQISGYIDDASVVSAAEENPIETDSIGLSDQEADEIRAEIEAETDSIEKAENDRVINILLVGVDRRDARWNGNSDTMILVSVNPMKKKIYMISFMRDLYAQIEGHGVRKLNAAYAYGAGPFLVKTLEDNYKVHIDNYASVDFNAMIDIIDILGGLEIDITDAEAKSANAQVMEMCEIRKINPEEHFFKSGGLLHCNGIQTVAYARLRAVGNSDYERTERQRYVLELIIDKMKKVSFLKLDELAHTILPMVTHNIDEDTMYKYLNHVIEYMHYEIIQDRVPYDDMFSSSGEVLVPVMPDTINRLQSELYGDE